MEHIVCYQYKTGSGKLFFSFVIVYNMTPIAAWKIKQPKEGNKFANFNFVVPENSFFIQDKPLNEFLNNYTKRK